MSSGADVLAQVEAALEDVGRYYSGSLDHQPYYVAKARTALVALRALRATAVERDQVIHFCRKAECANDRDVTPALLLLPTPTASTSPEHEEGA